MRYKIILIFVLIFVAFPIWLYLNWQLQDFKPINILVVNKTVSSNENPEHTSLFWVLENNKYTKWDGTFYDKKSDYIGFRPYQNKKYFITGLEKRTSKQIVAMSKAIDAAYFSDTYGIYTNDWYGGNTSEISKKIYGGTTENDLHLIRLLKKQKKLIIAEFNCMGSPTSMQNRIEFERLFNMQWTGWIGRYYFNLDSTKNKELPKWAIKGYEYQHQKKWKFTGQGIILVKENGQVEILEHKIHLQGKSPLIITKNKEQEEFNLPNEIKYPFWFEIIKTSRKNKVVSVFKLNTNKLGDSILSANNILKVFPAVISSSDSGASMYYFAADFCDNPIKIKAPHASKPDILKSVSLIKNSAKDREYFFYAFYYPLIKKIIADYYKSLPQIKKDKIPYLITE